MKSQGMLSEHSLSVIMANLFSNSENKPPLSSHPVTPVPSSSPSPKPSVVPSRFSGNAPATPRSFDRNDKPMPVPAKSERTVNYTSANPTPPLVKPRPTGIPTTTPKPSGPVAPSGYRPFSSPNTSGTKRILASGTVPASRFQKSIAENMTPQSGAVSSKPSATTGKTILPPKGFRSRRMSPALIVIMMIIIALVAAGLIGYFVFPTQVKTAYHQVLIAIGLEQTTPLTTVPPETISTTPKISTLDDITFTETSDPASGTSIGKDDRITYTLSLHNSGDSNFDNLSVSNPTPAGTERLTVISTPTGSKDNSTENSVEIGNISLASGQTQLIRFQVTVKNDLAEGTDITNTATLALNGSRKVSNNNSPSSLSLAFAITPTITPIPENTPTVTPISTATPAETSTPTATVAETPTPTATLAPVITPIPTVTVVPEETTDRAAPEDYTTVKTGGNSLTYLFVFIALTVITGIALIFIRRQATR